MKGMKKTICDRCRRRNVCPVFERARGMACSDFEKKAKQEKSGTAGC